MKLSRYPLELDLGMRCYASDTDGIGGKLRTEAEDFIVEEIPLPVTGTTGPYLICRLTKKNWEHQHAIKEIANKLGISHRRIGWGGTKDRRAVTTQYISIYRTSEEAVAHVRLKDISIEPVRWQNAPLSLGDLEGNRFSILIRNCSAEDLFGSVETITRSIADGIPNYYGLQRFGGVRPVTHRVGEHILSGDYEQAVLTYIGQAYPREPDPVREVRRIYAETHDPLEALKALPPAMGYERAMLQHLHNRPGDYAGALQELPPKLLSMFVSAFQSYLFNEALSLRLMDGVPLTEPVVGDRLLFANGKEDCTNVVNISAAALHIRRGRCTIALFMPGKEPFTPANRYEEKIVSILEERRITADHFRRASGFVRAAFSGALRPIALQSTIETATEGTGVHLSFILPPGHYATTVAREYMKADPFCMI
jgi:tRNA pseudouridine13 synthase